MGRRRGGGTKGGREGRSFSPSLGSWMSVFLSYTVSHKLGSQSWTSSMAGLKDQLTGWFEYLVRYVLQTPTGCSARAVALRTWFLWMSALAWSALSFWEPGIWVSRASVLVATGHFLGPGSGNLQDHFWQELLLESVTETIRSKGRNQRHPPPPSLRSLKCFVIIQSSTGTWGVKHHGEPG